jgi:ABC-type nickel/cobalt efflux system permease component RcnA
LGLALAGMAAAGARAHDIPNERVDRSIQVTLVPGQLRIDYEVSLTELTLTQDLRALIGTLPGGDRSAWLTRYAEVTGPLNAKGFLVSVNGQPVVLSGNRYDLVVEEHPRYTFHFEAAVAPHGRLSVRDRNYVSSEGTSRLAIRGRNGVTVSGDGLPEDVEKIPARPVWQLSDDEERRTKQVEVQFRSSPPPNEADARAEVVPERNTYGVDRTRQAGRTPRLSEVFDRFERRSWILLALIALGLGAAHAIQPGHGKTLVTAVALGSGARLYQPALLGLATTLAHTGSVLLIAGGLWFTGAKHVGAFHRQLTQIAGFVIAAVGFWRVGRYFGGNDGPEHGETETRGMSNSEIVGLGFAGGLVPCWDAVGLVVLSAALGRLAEGVALVLAFSAGMAVVLLTIGWLAWKFKSAAALDRNSVWERRLDLAGGAFLSALGLYLAFG